MGVNPVGGETESTTVRAERLGVNSSECVVVGDRPIDVEAGRRAGALRHS